MSANLKATEEKMKKTISVLEAEMKKSLKKLKTC